MTELASKSCADLGELTALKGEDAEKLRAELAEGWKISGDTLKRRYKTKSFAPALRMANVVGFLAEKEGHHPDISLGWGYVEVEFTTHDVGGLSEKDFICAAKLDAMELG